MATAARAARIEVVLITIADFPTMEPGIATFIVDFITTSAIPVTMKIAQPVVQTRGKFSTPHLFVGAG